MFELIVFATLIRPVDNTPPREVRMAHLATPAENCEKVKQQLISKLGNRYQINSAICKKV